MGAPGPRAVARAAEQRVVAVRVPPHVRGIGERQKEEGGVHHLEPPHEMAACRLRAIVRREECVAAVDGAVHRLVVGGVVGVEHRVFAAHERGQVVVVDLAHRGKG